MTEPSSVGLSTRRRPGVGFPTFNLADTSEALKKLGKYGKTHSTASIATYLGHKTDNSGPFRMKLASMREWGVLAGTGDRLSLTSTGLAIALPTSEDSEKEALQKAFFSAAVFAKTYADVAKDTPLELTALGNNAVHTHGVSITARDDFTRSLVASAIAAGIATAPDSTHVIFSPIADVGADAFESGGAEPVGAGPAVRRERPTQAPPVLRQVWPIASGEIVLEILSTSPLKAVDFAQIGKVVSELQNLASQLASDGDGAPE